MAIITTRPLTAKALNLRLPFRRRQKSAAQPSPPPDTKEEEFRRVFQYFDANNDGKISAEELRSYFLSIGDNMSAEEAERIMRECTKGDSLLLEFDEFVTMMELRDSADDDMVLRQAFEVYEVDKGSGCITPEGLRQVLRRLGDVKSYEECKAMIRVFDLDGNGVLDFHEFHRMMMT